MPSARRLKQASRCGEDPRNGREQRLGGDAPSIARLKRGLKQPATASEAVLELTDQMHVLIKTNNKLTNQIHDLIEVNNGLTAEIHKAIATPKT